ncbi:MAG: hypothetical protein ACYDAE_17325 [Steroidobacteraceae bacterium]
MSRDDGPTTIELTNKRIKLALAITAIGFVICLIGTVVSFGEPNMNTEHWVVATLVFFAWHQIWRVTRWWRHG